MDRTSVKIFQSKKATLQQGDEAILKEVGRGKDIISIFCAKIFVCLLRCSKFICFTVKANMAATEEARLPESEIIAQMTYVSTNEFLVSYS